VPRQKDRTRVPVASVRPPSTQFVDALETLAFGLVAITSRAIEESTNRGELTFQQWRVLAVLGTTEDGLRISALASRIAASGPSTSRLVRRLGRRGLLAVSIDPTDGRAVRVCLAPAGAAVRQRVVDRRRALIEEIVAAGSPSAALARRLADLASAFEPWV
jgi:DNA-binding MarR family transcriptional regulator